MGYDLQIYGEGADLLNDPPFPERGYFRIGIFSMSTVQGLMDDRGMLCEVEVPEFPEYELDDEYAAYEWLRYPQYRTGVLKPPAPADLEYAAKYLARLLEVLSAHPGEELGIPVHKLSSNDGWRVTAVEINSALHRLECSGVPDPTGEWGEWWPDWVAYLRLAANYDGFEVF